VYFWQAGRKVGVTRIVTGCIVRNRAWILPEYLAALAAVDFDEKEYIFLENDSTDDTLRLIDAFMRQKIAENRRLWLGLNYRLNPPGHRRHEYGVNGYERMAGLRNLFLYMFLCTDADYLLSIDSDIIVPPDIVSKLLPLAHDYGIAAAAIANIPGENPDGRTPGNFMIETAAGMIHPPQYPVAGNMEVAVTGAVYLIPRWVVEAGTRYGAHPQGEDVPFCIMARQKGCRLVVSFDVHCEHRMVEGG
jgi:glycosyltransferase involved in cell wall biosynthesis